MIRSLLLSSVLVCPLIFAQTDSRFNVSLQLDFKAADLSIQLFEDQPVNTAMLAGLRGNRIAASTTGLIENRHGVAGSLQEYLDSLKYHQIIQDDVYRLEESRKNAGEIKELLDEIEKRNFSRRVIATVEQIFPADADISLTIPVYVVALGHENVDAYVRRVIWRGDVPTFVGEGEGELTIVINLAGSVTYGPDLDERFISLLGVVAHEVFHAAFDAYKEKSQFWQRYHRTHGSPFDQLIELTQNEGIAYYLSLDQRGRGYLPPDWRAIVNDAFEAFNRNAAELLSEHLTPSRASELIRNANLSGYRGSYGAMTGMAIARSIDLGLGRAALIETIAGGPIDMLRKYNHLCAEEGGLPLLSSSVIREIDANR
jgi:hypothetical protein